MGAPKLLGGVALFGSTVFYFLPMSMHLVSGLRVCWYQWQQRSAERARERERTGKRV